MSGLTKRTPQRDYRAGEERLTTATRIRAVLQQLHQGRELLAASVPGCPDAANTAILGIEQRRAAFYLDELSSASTHQALLRARKLRIDCRLQGTRLHFVARLLKRATDNGLSVYEMALPSTLSRVQRRESFRLRLNPGLSVQLNIPDLAGATVAGEAFDLSATGIGAFLHTREQPARGDLLQGVALSLPGGQPLQLNLEVRFASRNTGQHMMRIGARFAGLDREQERRIARFLAEQQRKRRRHDPR
jgi:c-di-GMP-binding flagellar brake protein YcgR